MQNKTLIWVIITMILGFGFLGALLISKKDQPDRIQQQAIDVASTLGMDIEKFKVDMKSDAAKAEVDAQRADAVDRLSKEGAGVATPTVFVAGKYLDLSKFDLGTRIQEEIAVSDGKPVLVEEFFDYNCPHCYSYKSVINSIKVNEEFKDKIEVQEKHLPFLKDSSYTFAYAAEAARMQGKFEEFHDALFEKIHNK
jgi:protein-disulfide isomerase